MNWYTKSKSSITQPSTLDAKQLRRKEIRSQSIPHNLKTEGNLPEVNLPSPLEDDTESGICSNIEAHCKYFDCQKYRFYMRPMKEGT